MIDLLWSVLFYSGLLLSGVGLVSLIRPIRWLRMRTRGRAAVALAVGAAAITLPSLMTPTASSTAPLTRLDEFAPVFHFRERHETMVGAPPAAVFAAITSTTAAEIRLFQAFTWIRRFGQSGPESILNAPDHQPILEVAIGTTFLRLAEDAPREVVVGTVITAPPGFRRRHASTPDQFMQLMAPGFVLATLNFLVTPLSPSSSLLSTETRVYATSDSALRRFTPYWRAIYPGSAILRTTWLAAIKSRAEGSRDSAGRE